MTTAVTKYVATYFTYDPVALRAQMTPRCQDILDVGSLTTTLLNAKTTYGAKPPRLYRVTVVAAGTVGRATYRFKNPSFSMANQAWQWNGTTWLYDECSAGAES